MLDNRLRTVKDILLIPIARQLYRIPPTLISLIGLFLGLGATVMLTQQQYAWAFMLWAFNRIFDGLDGAVARINDKQTDLGGYLDILFDFIIYGAVPIAIVVGQPSQSAFLALAFLLFTFYVNAASWMYLSAILEKRNLANSGSQLTAVKMPVGLIGGTETIMFYSVFILFPGQIVWAFSLMGLLVVITICQRVIWAARALID
jgi:phosphatidylglycerophosphate synthase